MSVYKEIRYGTDLHTKILEELVSRRELSKNKMRDKYSTWKDVDQHFQFYVNSTENDVKRKAKRKDGGVPTFTTVEVPYSYALCMTAHSYATSTFLARNPIFQFTGRHGEAEHKVQALEALIDYQVTVGQQITRYFIWLMDKYKYGFGVLGSYWDEEMIAVSEYADLPVKYMGMPIPGKTKRTKIVRQQTAFQGTRTFNCRVYDWYPDPRKSLSDFQAGEFCGHRTEYTLNDLIKGKETGKYFNIDVVEKFSEQGWPDKEGLDFMDNMPTDNDSYTTTFKGQLKPWEGFQIIVELSPERWKLGKSTYPEKWVFEVAHDRVIINARPLGAMHNQYPYSVLQHEFDGYQLLPRGMMEIGADLNDTMSWLLNSHFFNVRKAINDTIVVDPSMVVMKDVTDPGAGKIIRKKPAAYGKDTRLAIHQLQIQDITRGHIPDMQVISQLMSKVMGVAENFTGSVNSGGRKSASEVRIASAGSVNRLKTHTEFDSVMGFYHLAKIMVSNTQQYYDGEKVFKLAGDLIGAEEMARGISPEDIGGFYDFIPVDGTMPLDRFAMANLWREFLKDMTVMPPEIAGQYDLRKIVDFIMQTAGAKNVQQFKIQVRNDGDISRDVQRGNIVPMNGGNNGEATRRAIAGRSVSQQAGSGEPRQIPGMGSTG